MMANNLSFIDRLQLSFDFALIGRIPKSLRGITVDWQEPLLTVHFFFDREGIDEEAETMDEVLTEIISHFPEIMKLDTEYKYIDSSNSIRDYKLKWWIFLRGD